MTIQPKISIIIPVYNTEKYLPRCLDSILSQTLKELEIILIDDGSTDKSREICDEYAQKDQRIKVIHKKNAGMGIAYNTGIDIAQGEYIGFVEPDDWIEPSMYENLYKIATNTQVDVVKSLYSEIYDNKDAKLINKFLLNKNINKIVNNALQIREFYMGHVSHWSAIYRRALLGKNIRFNTTPGAASQDIGFGWQVFTQMKSCYILTQSFYNYYQHSNQSISQGYKTATNAITEHLWINQLINTNNYPIGFIEIEAKTAYGSFLHHYNTNCNNIEKIKYLIKGSKLFKSYLKTIKFTNFKQEEKKQFKLIAKHPLLFYFKTVIYKKEITLNKKKISFLGLNIKSQKNSLNKKTKRLLGIPYYKKITKNHSIKKYFLGIKYKTQKKHICKIDDTQINEIINKIFNHSWKNNFRAIECAQTNHESFYQYKNTLSDKNLVIVATGPTINYFKGIDKAIYAGCNRAIQLPFKLDYLFIQDWLAIKDYITEIQNYPCTKFVGKFFYERYKHIVIPESEILKIPNAKTYCSAAPFQKDFYPRIDIYPITDYCTVAHVVLQFALYSGAKKIFLAGCDSSNTGYFDGQKNEILLRTKEMIQGYKELKKFASLYYPDTEIISINPVGLRGLFTDVYTEEYLQEHTEIDKALVKILQKDGEIK